jgi:hypothetical protein
MIDFIKNLLTPKSFYFQIWKQLHVYMLSLYKTYMLNVIEKINKYGRSITFNSNPRKTSMQFVTFGSPTTQEICLNFSLLLLIFLHPGFRF